MGEPASVQKPIFPSPRSHVIKDGPERAPQRSLLKAVGVKDEDLGKPFVALVNSYVDIVPGHAHLAEFGKLVKRALRDAGMVPFEFNTIAVDDGIAMGHDGARFGLPSREIIADSVETMIRAHAFDAMVCIPNCDKIVPGMLMAAARCDIPAIFVSGGPMAAGKLPDGRKVDLMDVLEGVGQQRAGKISLAQLKELEDHGCPSCGSCSGMFTANSMNCLTEALGLSLPYSGTALANTEARERLAEATAWRVGMLIREDLTARKILSAGAFADALALDVALGGSTNTLLHLIAIAHEAGVPLPLESVNAISDRVPYLCKLSPGGRWHMEDLHRAGGVPGVLSELAKIEGLLHLDRPTVSGESFGATLDRARVIDGDVIRPLSSPHQARGSLAMLFGNLAPEGAVVKAGGVDPKLRQHVGPARVFDGQDAAIDAIRSNRIHPGDVVVIRYEGPAGGPGMQEMIEPTSALNGMGLGDKVALITDGRFSGTTRGACIGHVSPEAAARGPLAALQEGDLIEIDLDARKLNVRLSAETIASRLAALPQWKPRVESKWLRRYARLVTSASKGAVLEDL